MFYIIYFPCFNALKVRKLLLRLHAKDFYYMVYILIKNRCYYLYYIYVGLLYNSNKVNKDNVYKITEKKTFNSIIVSLLY